MVYNISKPPDENEVFFFLQLLKPQRNQFVTNLKLFVTKCQNENDAYFYFN